MSDVDLGMYTDFVVSQRFGDVAHDDWRERSADYLDGEFFELFMQHGNTFLLMLPGYVQAEMLQDRRVLQDKVADEMGDCVWFCFDVAERAGIEPARACQRALQNRGITVESTPETVADVEFMALLHASDITVPTKWSLLMGDESLAPSHRSLLDSPFYVMTRLMNRLSHSLREGRGALNPPTATALEAVQDLEVAVGDYILGMAYMARKILDVPFVDVVEFNRLKLLHRQEFGKDYDIQFSDYSTQKRLSE